MTTYLIDYSASWVGFATLGAGDRLVVTPAGSLILPDTVMDLRGSDAASVTLAGFTLLDALMIDGATALGLTATGQFISDTEGAAITLGSGARAVAAGAITALAGTAIAMTGSGAGLTLSGSIEAETGIAVTGRGASLTLSGSVAGSAAGVVLAGGSASLTNTGTILGGVAVSGDAGGVPVTVTLTNGGTLAGGVSVGLVQADSAFWLANAGRVLGDVTTGRSGDAITGSGLIEGHVWMGAGDDRFAGRLTGTLDMGAGNDTVDARGGAAGVVRDGGGADLYLVDGAVTIEDSGPGRDTVEAWVDWHLAPGLEVLELQGVQALRGLGNALANVIAGNDGANYLSGAAGRDALSGGEGADTLRGGLGGDRLDGGAGDDRLNGDWGRDVLTGGSGADVFVFALGQTGATAATADLITDFAPGDRIDLSQIDAIAGNAAPDDAFVLVASFTGTAGEVAVTALGSDTLVILDVDGDGVADAAIRLAGAHALTAADFLL